MPLLICLQSGADSLTYVYKITRTTQNISSPITYLYLVWHKPTYTKIVKYIQYQHKSIWKIEQVDINTLNKRWRLFSQHLVWEDAPPTTSFRRRNALTCEKFTRLTIIIYYERVIKNKTYSSWTQRSCSSEIYWKIFRHMEVREAMRTHCLFNHFGLRRIQWFLSMLNSKLQFN